MKKKILFVDLDGTLLDDNKDITPGNLEAIQKAADQGHAVVITTGRPLYSTIFQLEKLHMDKPGCYAITSNGALIYDAYTRETSGCFPGSFPYPRHDPFLPSGQSSNEPPCRTDRCRR